MTAGRSLSAAATPQRVRRALLALTACLLLPLETLADCEPGLGQYRIVTYTTTDGLPLDTVTALAQTPDGLLWVGTEDGLARFDGVTFVRIPLYEVIGDAPASFDALLTTAEGHLLGGTSAAGIVLLPADRSAPQLQWPGDHGVLAMVLGQDGTVWVGSRGLGLLRRSPGASSFEPVPGAHGSTIRALALRSDGGLWVGYEGEGLAWFDGKVFHRPAGDAQLRAGFVEALIERRDGSLWIAAREGLFRLADGDLEDHSERFGVMPDRHANALLEIDDGSLWVGTAGAGVLRLCGDRVERLDEEDGLASSSLFAMKQDREGSVWLGTGGGVVQLSATPVLGLTKADGLPDAPILPVLEHSDGSMWIGTFGGGVLRWFEGEAQAIDGLGSDRILSLAEGPEGEVWIGSRDGLFRRDRDGSVLSFGREEGLRGHSVPSLLHDGEVLWIGSLAGLQKLRDGRVEDVETEGGEFDGRVVHLHLDQQGRLWVATDGAGLHVVLNVVEDKRLQPVEFHDEMPSRVVLGVMETAAGVLWFHTARGLLRYDGEGRGSERFGRVTSAEGLPDPQVFAMLEDDHGGVWMSGNRGVFRVDGAELDAVTRGELGRIDAERFDASDGMPATETNGGFQPAGTRSRDGRLWFPTMGGVAVFDPQSARRLLGAPAPRLETLSMLDHTEPVGAHHRIPPRPDWVEFTYTAPTFLRATHLVFEHRLIGFDDSWYRTQERSALFRKPSAGRYTFEVRVRRPGGEWSPAATTVLVVERHLLQQPLLWLAALLLTSIGAALGIRQRLRLRARHRERMERAQRMEAVGLLAGGVAHDFNNVLTAIIAGTDLLLEDLPADSPLREDVQVVMDAAERGAGLTRQLLTFARRQPVHPRWIDLTNEIRAMEPFLRSVLPRRIQLDFQFEAAVGHCFIDPVQLQQVVLNLVVNGRDAIGAEGTLRLRLSAEASGHATLEVTDTGAGIDPAVQARIFEPLFTTKSEGTGLGLAVSAGIVQQAAGRISVQSRPGEGTTFKVELPVVERPPAEPQSAASPS